jgi:hypothetical protein
MLHLIGHLAQMVTTAALAQRAPIARAMIYIVIVGHNFIELNIILITQQK